MIPVIVFYLHTVFAVYIFVRNYIEEGFLSGFLSLIFVVIIFSVGWTISEFAMAMFMKPEGLSILFPRFAFSLLLVTMLEVIFYSFYYSRKA
jgi:hypothetical protein